MARNLNPTSGSERRNNKLLSFAQPLLVHGLAVLRILLGDAPCKLGF
jgi:hypothetical protein